MKNELDPLRLECIRHFSEIALDIGLEFVIVGAAARDLILFHQYDINTRRRTEDIDFAVLINDWSIFEFLRDKLLSINDFTEADEYHRVIFQSIFPIDFIPFGNVEKEDGTLTLPPDYVFELNMTGFKEVFEKSIQMELDEKLIVNVATLAGLAILKILAWKFRIKDSDPYDLSIIIENYIEAGNKERFYNDYTDILSFDEFDYVNASAWLLGVDINANFSKSLRESIIGVINTNDKNGYIKLAFDLSIKSYGNDDQYDQNVNILNNLKNGINGDKPVF